ncbi:MAG TPA: trypsin-like peptidase domain-containing protein [Planctomycetota bacterium]|nr:trypsin-like peptidase domain-containing protein [Planctomycetota bacterium]HRT95151.1 trypsin-like peptidase domain-containing protein [Planctomycetota bacterium]
MATADGAFGGALAPAHEATRRTPVVIAVEKAGPSVVNISTEQIVVRQGDPFYQFRDPFFDQFFSEYFERFARPQQFRTHSLGSGVIIDPEGHVVTNEHVVRKASRIDVTLADGSKYEGKLLSGDPESDLALIELNAKKPLPALRLGRSDDLMIGETVIALGNPFGLESTVTVGVVSAKNRSVTLEGREAYAGLVQTDAAINPGNSGGALVNIEGELIGINVAIRADAQGIGFAIPVDRVREVLKGLFNYRLIKKTYIGVRGRDLTPEDMARHKAAAHSGVLVVGVDPDSPAARAGLAEGDLITAVDSVPVADMLQFFKKMLDKNVGDTVALRVLRGSKDQVIRVTVAAAPKPSGAEVARTRLGLSLQPMTAELARSFGFREPAGLIVTALEPGGPGDKAGLMRGDVLLRVGDVAVQTLDQVAVALEQDGGGQVRVLIARRGHLYRAILPVR